MGCQGGNAGSGNVGSGNVGSSPQPGTGPNDSGSGTGYQQDVEKRFQRIEQSLEKLAANVEKLSNRPPSVVIPPQSNPETPTSGTSVVQDAPTRVTVYLPKNATLYVNGSYCPLTSSKRSFVTSTLKAGKRYYYTLRVDHVENGQRKSRTRRVVLTSGQHVQVHMGLMTINK